MTDQPISWIQPQRASTGFLPDIGARVRGSRLYQEPSRSIWISAAIMGVCALIALVSASAFGFNVEYFLQILVAVFCIHGLADSRSQRHR